MLNPLMVGAINAKFHCAYNGYLYTRMHGHAALMDQTANMFIDGNGTSWHDIAEWRRFLAAFRFLVLSNVVSADVMAGSFDAAVEV